MSMMDSTATSYAKLNQILSRKPRKQSKGGRMPKSYRSLTLMPHVSPRGRKNELVESFALTPRLRHTSVGFYLPEEMFLPTSSSRNIDPDHTWVLITQTWHLRQQRCLTVDSFAPASGQNVPPDRVGWSIQRAVDRRRMSQKS